MLSLDELLLVDLDSLPEFDVPLERVTELCQAAAHWASVAHLTKPQWMAVHNIIRVATLGIRPEDMPHCALPASIARYTAAITHYAPCKSMAAIWVSLSICNMTLGGWSTDALAAAEVINTAFHWRTNAYGAKCLFYIVPRVRHLISAEVINWAATGTPEEPLYQNDSVCLRQPVEVLHANFRARNVPLPV